VLHSSPFPCLTAIAGQIIYYLTRGVPGGQITRYFGHHSCVRPARLRRCYAVCMLSIATARDFPSDTCYLNVQYETQILCWAISAGSLGFEWVCVRTAWRVDEQANQLKVGVRCLNAIFTSSIERTRFYCLFYNSKHFVLATHKHYSRARVKEC
jgi:hypothetical protein